MYPQEDEEGEDQEAGGESSSDSLKIDRAEMIHLLQDFDIMGRGPPPDEMCGVFVGCGQALNPTEFKRCIARAALALAPAPVDGDLPLDTSEIKLRWLLRQMPMRIEVTKPGLTQCPHSPLHACTLLTTCRALCIRYR